MGKNDKNNEDEMVKLDGELNKVSGGMFNLDDNLPDGHEKSCFTNWFHSKNECSASPDGYHFFYVIEESIFGDKEKCKYCGEETD
ncbi:MAG: hypothetical protein E7241_10015 [Lachnospiraceae bacterium]|jgi:hypothetical protein|nr:hypothetical protein [Lachnospiraceae bacterium]